MADMKIQRDAQVFADDEAIGRVTHVIVDPTTREVTELTVASGGAERLIPISEVATVDGDRVTLRGAPDGAAFERERYTAVAAEQARAETAQRAEHGGAPLLDADEHAVQIVEADRDLQPDASGAYRLQLREEHLRVETREEQAGALRVSRRLVERTETVAVPVQEEHLIIERLPGSGAVTVDGRALKVGESIDVLLTGEKVLVAKEAVAYEHVSLHKEVVERTEQVTETLRKEELVIDDRDGNLVTEDGAPLREATGSGQG